MLDIRYEILYENSPLKRGGWCVLGIIVILFISSCSIEPQQKTISKNPKAKFEVPTFNADSAYYFVEKQVSFGPRVISRIRIKSRDFKFCFWVFRYSFLLRFYGTRRNK
jgi:hypothetical protein